MDSAVSKEGMYMQVVIVTHNVLPIRSLRWQNIPRHLLHLSIIFSFSLFQASPFSVKDLPLSLSCIVFTLSSFLSVAFSLFLFLLSFSYLHCLPVEMFPHPTSLERKLDVEEKRVIYAYNWWKRRPLRKIWLWNDLTFTDVTSACEVSIVDWYARFQFAEGKGGSCSMKKIKC